MTLNVLVAVDTESYSDGHPDQQVWARAAGDEEYGIRRTMGIPDGYRGRGTLYVNVCEAEPVGEALIREAISEITRPGYDVPLHTHPRGRYGIDKLTRADVLRQKEILAWGKVFIEKQTGVPVVAHRAGAFAANLTTIEALRSVDIPVDASVSLACFECYLARHIESGIRHWRSTASLSCQSPYHYPHLSRAGVAPDWTQ